MPAFQIDGIAVCRELRSLTINVKCGRINWTVKEQSVSLRTLCGCCVSRTTQHNVRSGHEGDVSECSREKEKLLWRHLRRKMGRKSITRTGAKVSLSSLVTAGRSRLTIGIHRCCSSANVAIA